MGVHISFIITLIIMSVFLYTEAQKENIGDDGPPLDDADDSRSKANGQDSDRDDKTDKNRREPESPKSQKKEKDRPQIVAGPNDKSDSDTIENKDVSKTERRPPVQESQTKLPMNCISDYIKFCENKFFGFRFNDGCHNCKCTESKKDYCEKGDCRYYVSSFDEAADYCSKIEKENNAAYRKQISDKRKASDTVKTHDIKVSQSLNLDRIKSNMKKEKSQIGIKKSNEEPNDINREKNNNKPGDIKEFRTEKANSKSPLENNTEENLKNSSITNSKTVSDYEKSLEKLIENSLESKKDKTPSKSNDKPNAKSEKKEKTDDLEAKKMKKKFGELFKNSGKSKNGNTSTERPIGKISALNEKVVKNPIKVSLSKISKQNIIKAMIYQLAWNELTIERLKKILKKRPKKHRNIEKIFKKLHSIQERNAHYKMKILKIVKREMVKNKNSNTPSHIGKRDMMIFKHTLKKLVQLNKTLHDIKVKDLGRRHRRRRHHKGSASLKTSFVMVFISLWFVITLLNC